MMNDELVYKASMFDEIKKMAKEEGFILDVILKDYIAMRDTYVDKTTYYEIVVASSKEDLLEGYYRQVGVIESLSKAQSMVMANAGDLHEYTYSYAAIMAYRYGIFNYPIFKEIYKYDHELEEFIFVEKHDGIK